MLYDVRYKGEAQTEYSEDSPIFQVKVVFASKVSVSSLVDYLSSTNMCAMFREKSEVLQALDLIVGQEAQASPRLASTPGNIHFPICDKSAERFSLGAGLEALRGFAIGVRAATARLLVNCQVDYTVFFQKAELAKVIAAYRQDGSSSTFRLESFLRRLQVQVTHINQQARFKIIVGLAAPLDGQDLPHPPIVACHGAGPRDVQFWRCDPNPESSLRDESESMDIDSPPEEKGRYITVAEFFRQSKYSSPICSVQCLTFAEYGIHLDPHMPVVKILSRNKQPAYLPADVCIVRDGQPARSRITEAQKMKMNAFAIRKPAANARSITSKGAELLGIHSGMNINSTLVRPSIIQPKCTLLTWSITAQLWIQHKPGPDHYTRSSVTLSLRRLREQKQARYHVWRMETKKRQILQALPAILLGLSLYLQRQRKRLFPLAGGSEALHCWTPLQVE